MGTVYPYGNRGASSNRKETGGIALVYRDFKKSTAADQYQRRPRSHAVIGRGQTIERVPADGESQAVMIGSRIVTLDKKPVDIGNQVTEAVDVYDSAGKSAVFFQTGLDKIQAYESVPFN